MEKSNIRLAKSSLSKLDKRSDIEQVRKSLYSIFIIILLSTEIFKKNEDIKIFIDETGLDFRDYVFKNRTLLISRVIRKIEKADDENLFHYLDVCKKLLFPNLNSKIDIQNKNSNSIDELLRQFKRE